MLKIDRLLKVLQCHFKLSNVTKVSDTTIQIQDRHAMFEPTTIHCQKSGTYVIWKNDIRIEFSMLASVMDYLRHNTIYKYVKYPRMVGG